MCNKTLTTFCSKIIKREVTPFLHIKSWVKRPGLHNAFNNNRLLITGIWSGFCVSTEWTHFLKSSLYNPHTHYVANANFDEVKSREHSNLCNFSYSHRHLSAARTQIFWGFKMSQRFDNDSALFCWLVYEVRISLFSNGWVSWQDNHGRMWHFFCNNRGEWKLMCWFS